MRALCPDARARRRGAALEREPAARRPGTLQVVRSTSSGNPSFFSAWGERVENDTPVPLLYAEVASTDRVSRRRMPALEALPRAEPPSPASVLPGSAANEVEHETCFVGMKRTDGICGDYRDASRQPLQVEYVAEQPDVGGRRPVMVWITPEAQPLVKALRARHRGSRV